MISPNDKLHKKIVQGLGDTSVSPALLAYSMIKESRYVQESFIQYFTNYIKVMSEALAVSPQIVEIKGVCDLLNIAIQEVGLTGESRNSEESFDYIAQ